MLVAELFDVLGHVRLRLLVVVLRFVKYMISTVLQTPQSWYSVCTLVLWWVLASLN